MIRFMIRTWCIGLVWGLSQLGVQAQQRYVLTAKEATDHAIRHTVMLRNLRIDRDLRASQNRELTGQAYPQVSGSFNIQKFFAIPVTLLPDFITPQVYGVLEQKGVKDGSGNPIQVPRTEPQFFPAQFGVPWQSNAGFALQQLLFQPDVFVGLQARSGALRLADLNIQVMEDSVRSNVLRAYYGALIAEKRKALVTESVTRFRRLLSEQEKLFANGFVERLDLEKTQVGLNNLLTAESQLSSFTRLGLASLKFAMGLRQQDTLELRDSLSTEMVKGTLLEASGFRYEDRNELKFVNTAADLQRLDLTRYRMASLPTVAAFWSYSRNALRQEFNFFNADLKWFKSNVAGLNLSVPIFDGLQRQQRVRQARMRLEKTLNEKQLLESAIDFQREAALVVLGNALTSLDVQERNMRLAEKVFQTTRRKYEQGVGSSFEVLQADQEYQTAQGNYFQALYDAVNARIGYFRAIGKL
ncbi:MAG: TolC family protein [Bacteroidetes bacterium]|nr:TolC family protein [Bacteroidota bacterium]